MTVAEIDAVAQAFHDGVANQDAASVAALYTEDARLLPPNFEPCEGRAAIQAFLEGMLQTGARSLDIEPVEIRDEGDVTIEYGRYALGIQPEGAETITDLGKYIVVHERQDDGSTKIVLDMFSSNLPAEAPAT
jgi:uncharacterized protein (TIGR02246 family)